MAKLTIFNSYNINFASAIVLNNQQVELSFGPIKNSSNYKGNITEIVCNNNNIDESFEIESDNYNISIRKDATEIIKIEDGNNSNVDIDVQINLITMSSDDITELRINESAINPDKPLWLINRSSSLQNIFINSNTEFYNYNSDNKNPVCITVSEGHVFRQTSNDLQISPLTLEVGAKIAFTHSGSGYKHANSGTFNLVTIKNLHNLVEAVKDFSLDDLSAFACQNQGADGIPKLGDGSPISYDPYEN